MRIVEKVLCIFALIGYVFLLLYWPGGGAIVTISMVALGSFYLVFSFALLHGIKLREIFRKSVYAGIPALRIVGSILKGCALLFLCLGIPFSVEFWPGNKVMFLSTAPYGPIVIFVTVISAKMNRVDYKPTDEITAIAVAIIAKRHRDYYYRILSRVIPLFSICIISYFFSPRIYLLELIYRDHPAVIEAEKKSWSNISNDELREKAREERLKVNRH